jgi:hypothetical protein
MVELAPDVSLDPLLELLQLGREPACNQALTGILVGHVARPSDQPGLHHPPSEEHNFTLLPALGLEQAALKRRRFKVRQPASVEY